MITPQSDIFLRNGLDEYFSKSVQIFHRDVKIRTIVVAAFALIAAIAVGSAFFWPIIYPICTALITGTLAIFCSYSTDLSSTNPKQDGAPTISETTPLESKPNLGKMEIPPLSQTNSNPIITPYICLILRKIAYIAAGNEPDKIQAMLPEGWEYLDHVPFSNHNYFGLAVKHSIEKIIVIAHRGIESSFLSNFSMTSTLAWNTLACKAENCSLPDAYLEAAYFSFDVRRSNTLEGCTFIETGHDLSSICAAFNSLVFIDSKCVTFDSPGTKKMLSNQTFRENLQNNVIDYLDERGIRAKDLLNHVVPGRPPLHEENFVSYLSEPNFINTLGEHIGNQVYRISMPHIHESGSKNLESNERRVRGLLRFMNKESGEPHLQMRVESWPTTRQYLFHRPFIFAIGYIATRILHGVNRANFYHEKMVQEMNGYKIAAFIQPSSKEALEIFDSSYSGDEFRKKITIQQT